MISEVTTFVCLDSCENGITREKLLAKCSGKSPFSDISGSKWRLWNFQCVKWVHKHVEHIEDDGRKRDCCKAEFQGRIRKERECLHCGKNFSSFSLTFRLHCFDCIEALLWLHQSLSKHQQLNSSESNKQKQWTVQKVTDRNPKHTAWAHWHGYTDLILNLLPFMQDVIQFIIELITI